MFEWVSGCSIPVFSLSGFTPFFVNMVMHVKALGPLYILILWLEVNNIMSL